MPLITCHDCRAQASTDARSCPQCGATLKTTRNRASRVLRVIWYCLVALVLLVVFRSCYQIGGHLNDPPPPTITR